MKTAAQWQYTLSYGTTYKPFYVETPVEKPFNWSAFVALVCLFCTLMALAYCEFGNLFDKTTVHMNVHNVQVNAIS